MNIVAKNEKIRFTYHFTIHDHKDKTKEEISEYIDKNIINTFSNTMKFRLEKNNLNKFSEYLDILGINYIVSNKDYNKDYNNDTDYVLFDMGDNDIMIGIKS